MIDGKRQLLNQHEILAHTPWTHVKSIQRAHKLQFPVEFVNGRPMYDPEKVAQWFKRRGMTTEKIQERAKTYKKRGEKIAETKKDKAS